MKQSVYELILQARSQHRKLFALLIDPDRVRLDKLDETIQVLESATVDLLLVGGSLILDDQLDHCVRHLRRRTQLPVVLFPGSACQITSEADALLLLSLISGRNPELLIGQHVVAAPYLRASGLEILATGYMLIDGGKLTTATYMSQAAPIPADKPDIAVCTAMAGEMLGLRMLYLDTGSGAMHPVYPETIRQVRAATQVPLLVGGGLRTPGQVTQQLAAGADMVVVGSAIERDPNLLINMTAAVQEWNTPSADKMN